MTISVEDAKETVGGFVAALTVLFDQVGAVIARGDVSDSDKLKEIGMMIGDYREALPQMSEAAQVVIEAAQGTVKP